MGGSPKKSKAEKAATRAKTNARYRAKKKQAGLVLTFVWIPEEVAKAVKGKRRIGVITSDEEVEVSNLKLFINYDGKGFNFVNPEVS